MPDPAFLDHVTLRTRDLEGTRAFLEQVLDLTPGYRPAFPFPGYWLYRDGEPVVHLIPGQDRRDDRRDEHPGDRMGEAIDHVGFRLTGFEAFRMRLEGLDIPYSRMELPELGERRLFIRTPAGILLELVFRDAGSAPRR